MIRDPEQMTPEQLKTRMRIMAGRAIGRASLDGVAYSTESCDPWVARLAELELTRRKELDR